MKKQEYEQMLEFQRNYVYVEKMGDVEKRVKEEKKK